MTDLKTQVALAALVYVKNNPIIGIGSGSTINAFIDVLADMRAEIEGCVAASLATEARLKEKQIPVISFNSIGTLPIYIDSADEINHFGEAIKGGGAALAREKVLAQAAKKWICIIEESKFVKRLGAFPLPIEVLPMARSFVAREIVKLGGDPVYREGVVTDNQNHILDVYHLNIDEPMALEKTISLIPGVVENGLFAIRSADTLLIGKKAGVETFIPE